MMTCMGRAAAKVIGITETARFLHAIRRKLILASWLCCWRQIVKTFVKRLPDEMQRIGINCCVWGRQTSISFIMVELQGNCLPIFPQFPNCSYTYHTLLLDEILDIGFAQGLEYRSSVSVKSFWGLSLQLLQSRWLSSYPVNQQKQGCSHYHDYLQQLSELLLYYINKIAQIFT